MPKSLMQNEESENEFSSANENSNLSGINPLVPSNQSNLFRQTSQVSGLSSAFNQNSSSSTSSIVNLNGSTLNNNNSSQNSNASSASANKKFRHQHFSKNIYIGTKNAERWDSLRNLFQFKNDVEFVSFLLTSAENEARSHKNGFKMPCFQKESNYTENSEDYEKEQSTSSFSQSCLQQQIHVKVPDEILQNVNPQVVTPKKVKRVQFKDNVNIINEEISKTQEASLKVSTSSDNNAQDHSISSTIDGSVSSDESNNTTEILDCRIEEKIKNELEEKQKLINYGRISGSSSRGRYDEAPTPPPISSSLRETPISEGEDDEMDEKSESIRPILSKRRFYDIRKAPTMLDVQLNTLAEPNHEKSVFDFKEDDDDDDCEGRLEINSDFMIRDRKSAVNKKSYKSKLCYACNTKHGKETCPIRNPLSSICNQIDFADWIQDHPIIEPVRINYDDQPLEDEKLFYDDSIKSENDLNELDDDMEDDEEPDNKPIDLNSEQSNEITFAEVSLPNEFEFLPSLTYPNISKSVFTKILIPKYTQIGPLVGVVTAENEIPDDCNMTNIFEIHDSILSKSIYFNTENRQKSNWIRYLQPAQARDLRNLTLIKVEDKIYFVSCMDINAGCELLYWSDDVNSAWSKKKVEKTNCGGCNLRFEHPLHYRTHCSVFHDPSFSLTIRKYHCKICGVAVLGKENIMKHAEKLHDGKGAYQCQYCKKFFLRLNYLEMHRTYGCAANPQRARPLCDFCGRKFCQPQKLKVHIKRMHSDMAEVLRDFQCKLCSKLLGSRAALQRHSKEVHSRNSAVVSCPRCQKLFQNRSNLKIHMLTHSGVRPFKCAENECSAAFTTKQCLQFHYKKVHGFTQEQMPKIERSVAYTFDAYSGGLKNEALEGMTRRQRKNLGESLDKVTRRMPQREKEIILKDKNFLSSITDLCKSENNLNLLSSKISSILNSNLRDINKKLLSEKPEELSMEDDEENFENVNDYTDSMNASGMEQKSMLSKNMRDLLQQKRNEEVNDSFSGNDTNDLEHDDDDCDGEDSDGNSFKTPSRSGMLENSQLPITSNPRFKDFLLQNNPNLVIRGFYNGNINSNRSINGSVPTSASLLVEAALNSVSNMIESSEISDGGTSHQINLNQDETPQQDMSDDMTSQEFQNSQTMMESVDDNLKLMKSQNFPIHLPSMASFNNNVNTNLMSENNEIEVDASSTPKPHDKLCSFASSGDKRLNMTSFQNQANDSCSPSRTLTPDKKNPNYNPNFTSQRNLQASQIQTSPNQMSARTMYGSEHNIESPASTPSLPRYDFGGESYQRSEKSMSGGGVLSNVEYQKNIQSIQQQQTSQSTHISSDDENSIVIAENLSVSHQSQNHIINEKIKLNPQVDLIYANNGKYDNNSLAISNQTNQMHRESLSDLRLKYNEQGLQNQDYTRNSVSHENINGGNGSDYQGLDMSSRAGLGYHAHNFQLTSSVGSNLSFNRYQHHIYDILTDREQIAQSQQHQDHQHHPFQIQQPPQQQIQHLMQDHISHDQESDQMQSGVDLSRTSNTYIVPSSPPHLPYSHTHSEMLRMASLDLSSSSSGASPSIVGTNNSHHVRHHSSFLSHATSRDLPDHHRFLSATDQRMLVDPTAHLILEQNNRLLSSENNRILDQSRLLSDGQSNRHVVSPRGFGAYHHPHHTHHQ
ncbi:CLUMA_CG004886, isoform A, partial [Clunio marinus]